MKKLIFIALLIFGCGFGADSTKSIQRVINNKIEYIPIESQCYQDGYIEGKKFSTDDAISFGLGMIVPIAPFAYIILGIIDPKPSNHLLDNKIKSCKDSFILGYEDGAKKTRKSYLIKGFATLWISLIISSGGIN